jgi:hypothetical protein
MLWSAVYIEVKTIHGRRFIYAEKGTEHEERC